ncbi:hypothetical protein F441_14333 [Phytophthora nicotianae CJ01A1]|uniref:Uncharacterized protein n=4 Tax=Phytophthora nicotianae TaxID=4792 RepID=V9EL90_PHYNI|nr:hypothetical protein F443_14455 [Phytophthora nicotianae P1569]ETO68798.1 hypothetical protein F444_14453 [Phytophthora nicotianae P1976]ETP09879.1 hypothetical protein F441_14333 [Phytophthora nicotianae CJ01A1]ETP37946.1 hypothetical protein F442_14297 [Phytophthora nicotianae P10297]
MPKDPKHGLRARTRVLNAHQQERDWVIDADCNGIPTTIACDIVRAGQSE